MKSFKEFCNEEVSKENNINYLPLINGNDLIKDILNYTKENGAFENKSWFTTFAKKKWRSSHYSSLKNLKNPSISSLKLNTLGYDKLYNVATMWKIEVDFGGDTLWLEAQLSFRNNEIKFSYDGDGAPLKYIVIKDKELMKSIYAFYARYKYISNDEKLKFAKLYSDLIK